MCNSEISQVNIHCTKSNSAVFFFLQEVESNLALTLAHVIASVICVNSFKRTHIILGKDKLYLKYFLS